MFVYLEPIAQYPWGFHQTKAPYCKMCLICINAHRGQQNTMDECIFYNMTISQQKISKKSYFSTSDSFCLITSHFQKNKIPKNREQKVTKLQNLPKFFSIHFGVTVILHSQWFKEDYWVTLGIAGTCISYIILCNLKDIYCLL